jgi:hypothetical protein
MKMFHVVLAVMYGVNIGIQIMTGNVAGICGWLAALIAQIQIINSDWE